MNNAQRMIKPYYESPQQNYTYTLEQDREKHYKTYALEQDKDVHSGSPRQYRVRSSTIQEALSPNQRTYSTRTRSKSRDQSAYTSGFYPTQNVSSSNIVNDTSQNASYIMRPSSQTRDQTIPSPYQQTQ